MNYPHLFGHPLLLPTFLPETAWLRHGPFAMWLVQAARPKRFVELGTHHGMSYFAFCEAVRLAGLATECFAVDTWKGDEHAGYYGEEVFAKVREENRKYEDFSTLLRKTFAEARDDIGDGSVDILHVDGRHFYEDVKEDFESWIPKLSENSIILFHDTEVRERGFGVWKYWSELSARTPSLNFPYQHGLGVLFRGGDLSPELKRFREAAMSKPQQEMLIATFEASGEALAQILKVKVKAVSPERLTEAMANVERITAANTELQNEADRLRTANQSLEQQAEQLRTAKRSLEQEAGQLRTANRSLEQVADQLRTANQAFEKELLYARKRAHRLWQQYIAYKFLSFASNPRFPISERTRKRWKRSAMKRDPRRGLSLSYEESGSLVSLERHERPSADYKQRAKISMLESASHLTRSLSPRHSAKFRRSAEKRKAALDGAATAAPFHEATANSSEHRPVSASFAVRVGRLEADADVLVLVLFSADGRLSELHRQQIACYRDAGFSLVITVNSPIPTLARHFIENDPVLDAATIVLVRENEGFDFGAWSHALQTIGCLGQQRSISFTNDSIIPLDVQGIRAIRDRVSSSSGAVFLTENQEIRPHGQSYFFGFRQPGEDVLDLMRRQERHDDKARLIETVEVRLRDLIEERGVSTEIAFPVREAVASGKNPTIHYWSELIDRGFPFLKITLFTAGIVSPTDPRIETIIGAEGVRAIEAHLKSRGTPRDWPDLEINAPPAPALPIAGRFSDIGALQAFNPPPASRPAIVLPLHDSENTSCGTKKVLIVLHAFYTDLAESLIDRLLRIGEKDAGAKFRFVVTTDTDAKADAIRSIFENRQTGAAPQVMVMPNRGRDVAPFLAACARHLDKDDDLVLHIHTKKSPHEGNLSGWAEYVFASLFGSAQIVRSTMQLFDDPELGVVYPGPFRALKGLRNWGFDFPHARDIMGRLEVDLRTDDVLDFPTGTMFWARPAALKPLFELGLTPEDFEVEAGQIDGTLAHAIERTLCHVAEKAGFRVQPIVAEQMTTDHEGTELAMDVSEAKGFIARVQARLRHFARPRSAFSSAVSEVYEVACGSSRNDRPRLNVLVPTVQPLDIFGGVSTALRVGKELRKAHGDIDLRLLVTSASTDAAGVAEASRRLSCNFALTAPEDDAAGTTIVSMRKQRYRPLSIRARDYFMATAWWTADLGFRLHDTQADLFGAAPPMAYLIQDYEPGFYKWSSHFALAQNTYRRPHDTIAMINSEELASFVLQRHELPNAFCVPFTIEPHLAERLAPTRKERIILVYGRPSTDRNAFDLIVEGLRRWQSRVPSMGDWQILMAGEAFEPALLRDLNGARVVGKVSLDAYADLLNRASVGISMMVSPHPSYPPLEMAHAGVLTLTNSFECKDLAVRAPNITSLDDLSPDAVAAALGRLTAMAGLESETALVELSSPPAPCPMVDFEAVARLQKQAVA